MDKLLNKSRKLPDTEAAKDRRGERNYSKPKVIRIFNVSLEKNYSCLPFKLGKMYN